MKQYLILFLLLSCTLAFSQKQKQAGADPWAGTYKLDTAKSKFHAAAPKEETVVVDSATKDSVKYTIKGTDAQGNPYTVSYDGKVGTASPQSMDGKEVSQVTYQMPSAREFTSESHGSEGSGTGNVTLSRDNKTITVRDHMKGAQGEYDQTAVYVRQ